MNFSDEYEKTALHLTAIRLLTDKTNKSKKRYKLRHVNFDELKKISSSAALVLTAELSKWNDSIRNNLTPYTDNWDKDILHQLHDLGFFHLFKKTKLPINNTETTKNINLVKYIKGSCGDSKKTATLKSELQRLVGDKISKWAFLHSGLTEAITNVSHHAYPQNRNFVEKEKNWYLTGSYNKEANELKISFYDQGIGIPKSLPESEVWEKILSMTAIVGIGKGMLDETLLSAAMEMDRTSTGENDRGKGLQDLLEFIRQRKEGYLTVISRHGLYRLLIREGKEIVKKHSFRTPLKGTLIIWNVSLTDSG
ncbi:hypothetical protein [Pseudomonas sp. YY-1]|uniref:hypothetical protein n=1 Tax=Pseudomonas sp. YY-1 TaxID=2058659 RepID=UPI0012FF3819|nr:hypothetical protein [Pseudomonas sp. YY-1]